MAHFAQINSDNVVTQVIVVSNNDCGGWRLPSLGFNWNESTQQWNEVTTPGV